MISAFQIYLLRNFQIGNTVSLTVVAILCIIISWYVYNIITGSFYLLTLSFISTFHAPVPLATINLVSVSWAWFLVWGFIFALDFIYKWYHIVFIFLCLGCFPRHNALKVHLNVLFFVFFLKIKEKRNKKQSQTNKIKRQKNKNCFLKSIYNIAYRLMHHYLCIYVH